MKQLDKDSRKNTTGLKVASMGCGVCLENNYSFENNIKKKNLIYKEPRKTKNK